MMKCMWVIQSFPCLALIDLWGRYISIETAQDPLQNKGCSDAIQEVFTRQRMCISLLWFQLPLNLWNNAFIGTDVETIATIMEPFTFFLGFNCGTGPETSSQTCKNISSEL